MRQLISLAIILTGWAGNTTAQHPQFQLPKLAAGHSIDVAVGQAPVDVQPLLMELILDNLPHDFDHTKNWGKTKQVFSGIDMRFAGLELRTHRRWKTVNQGTWSKYKASLVDPHKNLRIELSHLVETEPGKVAFLMSTKAKLDLYGRLQEWQRGVRLYSVSADAIADIQLKLRCTMSTKLDITKLPPDIQLQPTVTDAEVKLVQFKLQRLSKSGGPIVRELGDGVEKILRRELAQKNERIVDKINRQIKKHEDDLRLSLGDAVKSKLFKPASLKSPQSAAD